jgi:predicted kinase
VPRLILLNGPPASGKSTLAQRYADDHPPALCLDIDRIRAMIGGWRQDPGAAGPPARAIAVAAATTHLAAGHDVVVPQLLARAEFIAELRAAAAASGAAFLEIFLLPDEAAARAQYADRARGVPACARDGRPGSPGVVSAGLTDAELAAVYARLRAGLADRPGAAIVRTVTGQVDQAYQGLLDCLRQPA